MNLPHWLVGAVFGLLLGSLAGHDLVLIGGLLGAFAGHQLGKNRRVEMGTDPETLERLRKLEAEVSELRTTVATLKGVQGTESIATPAVAVPTPAPSAPTLAPMAPEPEVIAAPSAHKETAPSVAEPLSLPPDEDLLKTTAIELPEWLTRFWSGNPLAKIGVILLFFGVASGLKLAVEFGVFPVSVRLGIAAIAGIALVVFGLRKASDASHRTFGLAIQGGGIALLYLVVYFMVGRYQFIGQTPAFALFALLGVTCIGLAARQDGPALAVLGLSGAFLAPVLAGGRSDTPLPLFSYFTLLNAFILIVDWRKSWRVLNIAGFVFTLIIGMTWGMRGYEDRHYVVTQVFLALFLATYSAMPVVTALFKAPGFKGWQDGILLFGTPLAGAFLQSRLMAETEYGNAWSALIATLWYGALWLGLRRRLEPRNEILERSQLGLSIAFLTIAVPLAFDAQVTSAFWAAEGAAVLWYGARTGRLLPQTTALLMQLASGIAFFLAWRTLGEGLPVLNDKVLGGLLISAAGFVSARILRGTGEAPALPPLIPFLWALGWWFGVGLWEIDRSVPDALQTPIAVLFVMVTVMALEGLAVWWSWPQVRETAILLLVALALACLQSMAKNGHPLPGLMAVIFPAALALNLSLLRHHERQGPVPMEPWRHIGGLWLGLVMIPAEISWQLDQQMTDASLWQFVTWALSLTGGLTLILWGHARSLWPISRTEAQYMPVGAMMPFSLLAMGLPIACFEVSGSESSLTYLPLLSIFDSAQLLGMAAMWRFAARFEGPNRAVWEKVILAVAFVWFSTLAARIAHAWGGVPFEMHAMSKSTLFQMLLTICWTVTSIVAMIVASRQSKREAWFAGFGLLGVVGAKLLLVDAAGRGTLLWTGTLIGVAVLVLAASYFAPLPPREKSQLQTAE